MAKNKTMSPALLASLIAFPSQYGMPEPLNPKTYRSPSGRFSLRINPSSPRGTGGAEYRLSEGGRARWSAKLPFTLSDAVVADDGRVAGYGNDGDFRNRVFIVAILDADGKTLHTKRHAISPSRFLHTDGDPKATGIVLDGLQDRVVVRIDDPDVNRQRETWWPYDLANGRPLPPVEPRDPVDAGSRYIVRAKGIPGTPLTLINRWHFDGKMGARFALVDRSGQAVWTLARPGDYEIKGTESTRDTLMTQMQRYGAILTVGPQSTFQLRFVKDAKRVTFAVTRQGEGWQVRETARIPYVAAQPAKPSPPRSIRTVQLKPMGRLVLPLRKRATAAVRDVEDFCWTDDDRLVFLRAGDRPAFVVADAQGNALRTVPLPILPKRKPEPGTVAPEWDTVTRVLARCGKGRFVVIQSRTNQSAAWRIDAKSGRIGEIRGFKSPGVKAIAGAPDGSFTVLATEHSRYTMSDRVARFDTNGKRLWEIREDGYSGKPEELLGAHDLAVDSQGRVVILDNTRGALQYFDRNGKFLRLVEISPKTSYPTSLTVAPGGRTLVYDFGSEKPLVTLGPDARRTNAVALRDTGGKRLVVFGGPQLDARGRLWASDRNSLYRFDAAGKSDRFLGLRPLDRGLSTVIDLTVGNDGTVYAMDGQSGDIGAFAPDGKPRFMARPLPGDFKERPSFVELQVTKSGDLYVRGADGGGLLKFSSSGRRVGYVPWAKERGKPLRQPAKGDWRWENTRLVDARGKVMGTLDRWPNGDWMEDGPSAVAPDGSLFAVDDMLLRRNAPHRMAWFSPSGAPQGMATAPPEVRNAYEASYDGRLAYFVANGYLVAVDRKGRPAWRHRLNGKDLAWSVFPSRGGIALFDGVKTVTWYAIP
ncbi:MAG: hypothetical protein ACO1SV_05870 [Fimbriimonas sp.]